MFLKCVCHGPRTSSTLHSEAFNCLIKVCSGFQVDYLLCDDYENENERKERNGKIFVLKIKNMILKTIKIKFMHHKLENYFYYLQ